jgi:hypothetical protein
MIAYAKRAMAYVLMAVLGLAGVWLLFGPRIDVLAAGVPLSEATEPLDQATELDAPTSDARARPCVQIGEKLACLRPRTDVQASRETAPVLYAASQVFTVFSRSRTTPVFSAEATDDPDDEPEDDDDQGEDDDDQGEDDDDQGEDDDDRGDDEDDDRDDDDDDRDDDDDDRDDDDQDDDDDDDRDDDDDDREKKPKKDREKKPKKDREKKPKNDRGKKPKCNQGVGNGPEGCDPGNSNHNRPSNDEEGGSPGSPGRGGGR